MTEIYIAGKYTAKERLKPQKQALIGLGYQVSSSWMETTFPEIVSDKEMVEEGTRDVEEVMRADMLIIDTYDESITGGREVELGMAMSNKAVVYRVGPIRNIFHHLIPGFDTWDELLSWITV